MHVNCPFPDVFQRMGPISISQILLLVWNLLEPQDIWQDCAAVFSHWNIANSWWITIAMHTKLKVL